MGGEGSPFKRHHKLHPLPLFFLGGGGQVALGPTEHPRPEGVRPAGRGNVRHPRHLAPLQVLQGPHLPHGDCLRISNRQAIERPFIYSCNCTSTTSTPGLFDPFTLEYGDWAFKLFGIPRDLMPPVVDSAGEHFGSVHPDIFGCAVPIRAIMADQVETIAWRTAYVLPRKEKTAYFFAISVTHKSI